MRHEKATRLLELARRLASSAEGMTLDEMADAMAVSRRTAERMRDAVREAFQQMEEVADPPTVRYRIPAGLDGIFQAPTAEEFAALRAGAENFRSLGAIARASALARLERERRFNADELCYVSKEKSLVGRRVCRKRRNPRRLRAQG